MDIVHVIKTCKEFNSMKKLMVQKEHLRLLKFDQKFLIDTDEDYAVWQESDAKMDWQKTFILKEKDRANKSGMVQ